MSILINGMDTPKDCASCDLSYCRDGYNGGYGYSPSGWRCRRLNHIIKEGEETRPSDCPLFEIPAPHGRLIDADEYFDKAKEYLSNSRNDFYRVAILQIFKDILNSTETVIEAKG